MRVKNEKVNVNRNIKDKAVRIYGLPIEKEDTLKVWSKHKFKNETSQSERTQRAYIIFNSYCEKIDSPINKLKTIKAGLYSSAITDLIELTGTNQSQVAYLLSITEPTLRKYIKNHKHLDSSKSEHILELFELFSKGLDTFGSWEEFKKWIDSPNIIFHQTPVKLLDTITGINMVKNALLRLDYGVLA